MRILLSTVPIKNEAAFGDVEFATARIPPMGLAYMAAVLEKAGHEVVIVDSITEEIHGYSQFFPRINAFKPDIIGFTVYTLAYIQAQWILVDIKKDFPQIKIIFGGAHPTARPEQTMEETPLLDYVIVSEGEYTLLDLANGKNPKEIQGLLYRENDKIIKNDPRQLITPLDDLPHPARHLLPPLNKYKDIATRSVNGMVLTIMSSRGCPFNCHFCNRVMGSEWRAHSVDYIFEEIDLIEEKIAKVDFYDDNFALDKNRLIEFCRRKIEGGYKFRWNCFMRLDAVEDKIIKLMEEAGCNCLFQGIESGDDETLRKINKHLNIDTIRKKIEIVKKYGIKIHGSIILGYPGETKESVQKTIDFALSLRLDGITVNLFTPFPGTILGNTSKDYGLVSGDWADYSPHSPNPPFIPFGFSPEELLALQKNTYKRFYFRPRYIFTHLSFLFNRQFLKTSIKALRYFLAKNGRQ